MITEKVNELGKEFTPALPRKLILWKFLFESKL